MNKFLPYFAMVFAMISFTGCGGGTTQAPAAPTYNLVYTSGGNGTLAGPVSQSISSAGSASVVTAVPAAGYHFVSWTEAGEVVGLNAALAADNITADHSYTANFAIDAVIKTTALLTLNLSGTIPTGTAIAGISFTITLPADVTPALDNGSVINGVVYPSGTFTGNAFSPQVTYTPATTNSPGTLYVILTSSAAQGVMQVGEAATMTLQLAHGAVPTTDSFVVSGDTVDDTVFYAPITGLGVVISHVVLQ